MTKHTGQDTHGSNTAGAKKFLYSGPKKRSLFDEDEDPVEPAPQWNFSQTPQDLPSPRGSQAYGADEFDLDEVWSIKKNVNVPGKPPPPPNNREGWSKNVQKSYYSRHGGLAGQSELDNNTSPSQDSGRQWGAQKTYSYSYTKPAPSSKTADNAPSQSQSPTLNGYNAMSPTSRNGGGVMGGAYTNNGQSNGRGGGGSYGRYGVQQGGKSNQSRPF